MPARGPVALAVALSITGCGAISEQDFSRLAGEVGARNDARYALAAGELEARGFRFVDDERLFVSIDQETRRACREHQPTIDDVGALAPASLRLAPATTAGTARVEPITVTAWLGDVCSLYRDQVDLVLARRPDDTQLQLARVDERHRLARDPSGTLVAVSVTLRTVDRRSVLVERHCDHMPSPGEDPIERRIHVPVVLAPAALPVVEMVVDREELDVRCTNNTY